MSDSQTAKNEEMNVDTKPRENEANDKNNNDKQKNELSMDMAVAERNIDILKNLLPFEKLIVDEHGNMNVDSRYLQSIRRTITRDSKKDILKPLELTFQTLNIGDEEKMKVLAHLAAVFSQTYPTFTKLHTLLFAMTNTCSVTMNFANTGKNLGSLIDMKAYQIAMEPKEKQISPPVNVKNVREDSSAQSSQTNEFVNGLSKSDTATRPKPPSNPPPNPPPKVHWTEPLSISRELCEFLNVSYSTKLSSREIEYSLHKYILDNKLHDNVTKTIKLDARLAKLCGCSLDHPRITNPQFKTYIFSRHIVN